MKYVEGSPNPKNRKKMEENNPPKLKSEEQVDLTLDKEIGKNLEKFKAFLKDSSDVVFREFSLGTQSIPCALVYVDGLVNVTVINEQILKPMMHQIALLETNLNQPIQPDRIFEIVKLHALAVGEIKEAKTLDDAFLYVLSGEVAVIIDGFDKILIANARGWPQRSIQEPPSEVVIRGPREGFTETLRVNTALLRRKIKDPNLVIKSVQIGRRSKTDVAYAYIKGVASQELVEEVERRLNQIDVDIFLDSSQIEQYIQDNYLTYFPQIEVTERPDKTAASLAEGRVAILMDNSPYALIVPATFYQFFQSPEDYYERWILASFIRLLRWSGAVLASLTPAIYVAIVSFHPGFIPTNLVISVAAARATVPFPAFVEALLMELTFELLREAGARLPRAIGQTIGIVGGLIIGDAAVRAGITSPIMVIVVAITAIASFIIPSYSAALAIRLIRFPFIVLAAVFGIYGVILGFIILNVHLVTIKSFGVSYMTPQAPMRYQDWKDFFIRLPTQIMKRRPTSTYPIDIDRRQQDPVKEEVR
ncbi:MAG: spore germination protein [Caldicoprobacter sp.]|uniref:spore germination protein n=1 Tax=Caldicoprobacter sp. TaxID=2004500 RepID=UPI001DD02FCD|nr:spore germination protein [Clostridia bacterium]